MILLRQWQLDFDAALLNRQELAAAAQELADVLFAVGVELAILELWDAGQASGLHRNLKQRVDLPDEGLCLCDTNELIAAQDTVRIGEQATVLDVEVLDQRVVRDAVLAGRVTRQRPVVPEDELAGLHRLLEILGRGFECVAAGATFGEHAAVDEHRINTVVLLVVAKEDVLPVDLEAATEEQE